MEKRCIWTPLLNDWLIVLCLLFHSKIFHSYGHQQYQWVAAKFRLRLGLMALSREDLRGAIPGSLHFLIVTPYSKPEVLRIYSNPNSHWTYAVKLTLEYFPKYSFFRVGVVVKVVVYHVLNYLPLINQAAFSSTLDRFFTNSCASLSPTREARMSRAPFSAKKTFKCK